MLNKNFWRILKLSHLADTSLALSVEHRTVKLRVRHMGPPLGALTFLHDDWYKTMLVWFSCPIWLMLETSQKLQHLKVSTGYLQNDIHVELTNMICHFSVNGINQSNKLNKRAHRALGRSPEEKVKSHSKSSGPCCFRQEGFWKLHNENLFFDPVTYLCNQSEPFEQFW